MPARKGKGGGKGGGAHGGAHGRARATAVDKQTKPVCGSGPWQPPSFQLHSAAAGQGPLGYDDANPEWQANTLYRSGLPADRKEAEALLRAAGLWEQRQEQLAERRGHLLRLCREKGAASYGALLRGEVEGEDSERQWCLEHCPEMVEEVDAQLRRIAEGLPPYPEEAAAEAAPAAELGVRPPQPPAAAVSSP
eukprot:TRINITY_DN1988_c0_g1_i13.p4 TRINITY_DN1988_c0_g1~~TRINITY_DN1988_c0_g1_i13.p4  ORF type:complete len:193 (+),score=57.32 TRINITY_DN1988_c0_g1_i13:99-677(+)